MRSLGRHRPLHRRSPAGTPPAVSHRPCAWSTGRQSLRCAGCRAPSCPALPPRPRKTRAFRWCSGCRGRAAQT
eukprot:792064-Rhodomonas_salina.1